MAIKYVINVLPYEARVSPRNHHLYSSLYIGGWPKWTRRGNVASNYRYSYRTQVPKEVDAVDYSCRRDRAGDDRSAFVGFCHCEAAAEVKSGEREIVRFELIFGDGHGHDVHLEQPPEKQRVLESILEIDVEQLHCVLQCLMGINRSFTVYFEDALQEDKQDILAIIQ